MESQLQCFQCLLVCSLGAGSLGGGNRCAQLSVVCALYVAEFERNVQSPVLEPCTVWTPQFLTLKFSCACSQAPRLNTVKPDWLAVKLSILLVILCNPFYQNNFLFNHLNV